MKPIAACTLAVLFLLSGCRRKDTQVVPAGNTASNESAFRTALVAEARRLGLDRAPSYFMRLGEVEKDLLAEALFSRWAEEDRRPENVVRCYQAHKNDFVVSYARVRALVRKEAKSAADLRPWLDRLAQGKPLPAMGETACDTGKALCANGGDLGYVDLHRVFGPGGPVNCASETRPMERWQGRIGPCQSSEGWGVFEIGDRRSSIPSMDELGSQAMDKCIRLQKTERLQRLMAKDQSR